MNAPPTKTCPHCAENIPGGAKICPRCRQWLSIWSMRNPATSALLLGVPMLALMFVLFVALIDRFDRLLHPRPFYSDSPQALQILEARTSWVQTTNGPRIYVTGLMTNQSLTVWADPELQCRFYDTNGALIDAAYPRASLTILPNGEAAFRAIVAPGRPAADYQRLKVTVSTARNARAAF